MVESSCVHLSHVPSQHAFRGQRRHAAKARQENTILCLRLELAVIKKELSDWRQWWWSWSAPDGGMQKIYAQEQVEPVPRVVTQEVVKPMPVPEATTVEKIAADPQRHAFGKVVPKPQVTAQEVEDPWFVGSDPWHVKESMVEVPHVQIDEKNMQTPPVPPERVVPFPQVSVQEQIVPVEKIIEFPQMQSFEKDQTVEKVSVQAQTRKRSIVGPQVQTMSKVMETLLGQTVEKAEAPQGQAVEKNVKTPAPAINETFTRIPKLAEKLQKKFHPMAKKFMPVGARCVQCVQGLDPDAEAWHCGSCDGIVHADSGWPCKMKHNCEKDKESEGCYIKLNE